MPLGPVWGGENEVSLRVGRAALHIQTDTHGDSPLRIVLAGDRDNGDRDDEAEYRCAAPVCLQLLDANGSTTWLSGGYSALEQAGDAIDCVGEIRTPSGTVFRFADRYSPGKAAESFRFTRTVSISSPSPADAGFATRLSLCALQPTPSALSEFFVPGIWYRDNRHVPPRALAANLSEEHILIREDRMPLPLVMMRNAKSGVTLALFHVQPDGRTCAEDRTADRLIDARLQFASLGICSPQNPTVTFHYPGTEGERSYLRGPRGQGGPRPGPRWAERFHPVQPNVQHAYHVLIHVSRPPDFPEAMRCVWRVGLSAAQPAVEPVDLAAVSRVSHQLLIDLSRDYNGVPGLPFKLALPGGQLVNDLDVSYQMGFVGQQLPAAHCLLRFGLEHRRGDVVSKGEAIVNFWSTNSLTPTGLPRTWYDPFPEPHWRQYNTFLRVATDGMVGALQAWDIMQRFGHPRPDWLLFCRRFGDWLISHQNDDGSWFREYDFDSAPASNSKLNSTHPIVFLLALSRATNDPKYRASAMRAAEFCYANVHQTFAYVGGTPDNPNVLDKEAGLIALEAFLAVHDVSGQARWLEAARRAGDFAETWMYGWDVPIPPESRAISFPPGRRSVGLSLIATGHSGADLFMARAAFLYYRLYILTSDSHYAEVARLTLYNTRRFVDVDGSLGYARPGLCTEALTLAPPRGHGVNVWLPWLTVGMLEPLIKLEDVFGRLDIAEADPAAWNDLRARDAAFARSGGLQSTSPQ